MLEAKTNIDADDINRRISKNGLLPTLNLSGFVASTGLGGNSKTTTTTTTSVVGPRTSPADVSTQIVGPNNQPLMVLNQNGVLVPIFVPTTRTTVTGTTLTPGGLNSAYNSLFTGKFPDSKPSSH